MTLVDHDPALLLEVLCQGTRHRIRWVRGDVVLDDHPDVDAELVLVALGGEQPACLAVAELWADALIDGGFVAEWSTRERPDRDRSARITTALNRLRLEGVQDLLVELPARRAARMGLALATFSPALQDQAAVRVAERVLAEADPASHELARFLARAVRVRARSAFVRSLSPWRDYARPAALVPFSCRVLADPLAPPVVAGRLQGSTSWCELSVGLPWLVDVWGCGLDVVDGHLVVACSGEAALAVDWVQEDDGSRRAALRPGVLSLTDPPGSRFCWER